MSHRYFEKNEEGRDFVIGDLHGCFDEFSKMLEDIDFDFKKDRMFSVGDLVDRGKQSMECLTLISEPWFFAVKGNHEEMMCDAVLEGHNYHIWLRNGGEWSETVDEGLLRSYAGRASRLPVAITVETKHGTIAITHAEPAVKDWAKIFDWRETISLRQEQAMLWSRSRIRSNSHDIVENVAYTIHGHTPVDDAVMLGNSLFIDTGIVFKGMQKWDGGTFDGKLTVLCISEPINTDEFVKEYKES